MNEHKKILTTWTDNIMVRSLRKTEYLDGLVASKALGSIPPLLIQQSIASMKPSLFLAKDEHMETPLNLVSIDKLDLDRHKIFSELKSKLASCWTARELSKILFKKCAGAIFLCKITLKRNFRRF